MLSSQFRQVLITIIRENAKNILGRELKDWEVQHFLNQYEEKLNIIIQRSKHNMELLINEHLESLK